MPLESTITAAIKKRARAAGWWVEKRHGGPFSLAGMPDLQFHKPLPPTLSGRSHAAVTVYIEVKRPGERPTALQTRRILELRQYGCWATWVTSADEAMAFLDAVDPCIRPTNRPRVESAVDRRPAKAERRGSRCQR
jgi:hypothetical protein